MVSQNRRAWAQVLSPRSSASTSLWRKILFSQPYFDADQALLVKKGSGITSFDQLKGKLLGVQTATTGKMYAEENAVSKGVKLKDYEDLALELKAVQTGAVAGAINDIPVLLDFAKKNTDVEVAATFETGEQYGFGMKMGNQALATVVNEIIAQAKADKVIVFKKKRRHNYRRKAGHRQQHTILRILAIGDEKAQPKKAATK